MIVPMIDQALAGARALIGAQGGVTPPVRTEYKDRGRAFKRVAAAEWRRLLNEALPRVNLLLLTTDEAVNDGVLTVTFALTHVLCGDTRTLTRAVPLTPAPNRAVAVQWAHTRAVNAIARTLLWQWDDEDEAQDEPGEEAKPEPRRAPSNGNGHAVDRNDRGAVTRTPRKAVAAAAALAHSQLPGAPIVAELGDEEREEEARQHAEAERLRALPSKIPPVPDAPGLMDDEPAPPRPERAKHGYAVNCVHGRCPACGEEVAEGEACCHCDAKAPLFCSGCGLSDRKESSVQPRLALGAIFCNDCTRDAERARATTHAGKDEGTTSAPSSPEPQDVPAVGAEDSAPVSAPVPSTATTAQAIPPAGDVVASLAGPETPCSGPAQGSSLGRVPVTDEDFAELSRDVAFDLTPGVMETLAKDCAPDDESDAAPIVPPSPPEMTDDQKAAAFDAMLAAHDAARAPLGARMVRPDSLRESLAVIKHFPIDPPTPVVAPPAGPADRVSPFRGNPERRARGARWLARPLTKHAKKSPGSCRECGGLIETGTGFRRGVSEQGYAETARLSERGVPIGVAHVKCVARLERGEDPKAIEVTT